MNFFGIERLARRVCALICIVACVSATGAAQAQQASTVPPPSHQPKTDSAQFEAAADEVLQRVSQITGLALLTPLKKTLRSRDEIRAYVLSQMDDEKNPAERYAEERSAEAFGLIPKGFPLDSFIVDLLTEQIAGLYDPKAREFYIADWIPLEDQRMVMAHELTHALQDQHFQIDAWTKAARPNDDAELARDSVLEGSAMAAMVDYLLRGTGRSVADLPKIDPSLFTNESGDSPKLKEAPPFIKDAMIFPYVGGLTFSVAMLKQGGWNAVSAVFARPPVSTQQIIHPELYKSGRMPPSIVIGNASGSIVVPPLETQLGANWVKLDENVMGEFGWEEILKQFLGDGKAKPIAAFWDGDRYELYEQKDKKKVVLLARLRLDSDAHATQFFAAYADALLKKYGERSNPPRSSNFFMFDGPDGGVFLRCVGVDCVTLEGTSRAVFDNVDDQFGWPAAPATPQAAAAKAH